MDNFYLLTFQEQAEIAVALAKVKAAYEVNMDSCVCVFMAFSKVTSLLLGACFSPLDGRPHGWTTSLQEVQ